MLQWRGGHPFGLNKREITSTSNKETSRPLVLRAQQASSDFQTESGTQWVDGDPAGEKPTALSTSPPPISIETEPVPVHFPKEISLASDPSSLERGVWFEAAAPGRGPENPRGQ